MSDSLRETIITSETASRMLDRVTPIYDDSYVGLWMFQVIGVAYDEVWDLINDLPSQFQPETATWSIELWEKRYGIVPNPNLSISERRARVLAKRSHPGALTPGVIEKLCETITGFRGRVEEHVAPYTFAVYLPVVSTEETELKRRIRAIKPSHMSFEIRHEEEVSGEVYTGISFEMYKDFALGQVN